MQLLLIPTLLLDFILNFLHNYMKIVKLAPRTTRTSSAELLFTPETLLIKFNINNLKQ